MDINFIVPPFARDRFTGGIWCILQQAQELGRRGHRVTVIPMLPSPRPNWLPKPWHVELLCTPPRQAVIRGGAAMWRTARGVAALALRLPGSSRAQREGQVREEVGALGIGLANYASHGLRQGGSLEHLRRVIRPADITLATDSETAWPACLLGTGQVAYFAQHYEPYFWKERMGGEASRRESEASYRLGLHQLANSPWLRDKLQVLAPDRSVHLCPNAVDHAVFTGTPQPRLPGEPLRIISYGGRSAEWKGFREMCEALRLLKAEHPALRLEWSVYGDALLPPDNDVFPYQALGFLTPAKLAAAYARHHVMLSASWYESFPLFPVEAMACGIAAITTQPGTELFAEDGQTALVVQARDVTSIAQAVFRLANDEPLRQRLCVQGQQCSRTFDWGHAGQAFEAALQAILARGTSK